MRLQHAFTVPARIEEVWRAFNDIQDVAGCFPGASVTSAEGDDFTGSCKVKLGPISLLYHGAGTFVERDESLHRFVLEAKGKDKRGNGTAGATVTATLTGTDEGRTEVAVLTDLSITGKPAQFGRGMIQDVSDKLLQQFVVCLESRVGQPPEPTGEPSEPTGHEPVAAPSAGPTGEPRELAAGVGREVLDEPAAGAGATGRPGAQAADRSPGAMDAGRGPVGTQTVPVEALDLGATVLPVLLKAYWRQAAGGLVALLVLRWIIRKRR